MFGNKPNRQLVASAVSAFTKVNPLALNLHAVVLK